MKFIILLLFSIIIWYSGLFAQSLHQEFLPARGWELPGDSTLDTESKPSSSLKDSIFKLKGITVAFGRNKFAAYSSDYVAKMPLTNLENPQVYNTIPKSVMSEQMAVNYNDIFKNIAGTEIPSYANNGRMDISSRGFKVRSQIVNGMSGYTMTDIDPANIEKVEVIRGPSATLFGSSLTSYGGLVNIVTKQPYDHIGGNLSYTFGSFGLNRLTLDLNTPLNKKHTLLFRINGAGQTEASWQDAGFAKHVFAAPSLSYRISNHVSVIVDGEYNNRKATSPFWFTPYAQTGVSDVRDLPLDFKHAFTDNDVFYHARQANVRVRVNAKMNDSWKSQTGFVRTSSDLEGLMLSLIGVSDSALARSVTAGPHNYSTTELQQNFLNNSTFGKFTNRLLLGLDFYHYTSKTSEANIKMDTANFIKKGTNYNSFSRAHVDARLANATYKNKSADQNTYSAYVSDVLSFNKRWSVLLSLRVDRFENKGTPEPATGRVKGQYGQTAFSPKVGLVYQPVIDKISLFANLMNGFQNVNGTDFEGKTFKPQEANQLEAGIKVKVLHGRLLSTLSFYNIQVKDILRDDLKHENYSVQDGTELSRGIDFSATFNPLHGLNVLAGYSYNFCEYQKADDGMSGLRPDGAGPENTANLWLSYTITRGIFKGFGIGGGGVYGGRVHTIKHFASKFNLPGYTVLDATVFYKHKFYRLGLKLNNLTSEQYWDNRLRIQAPRNFAVNLKLSF